MTDAFYEQAARGFLIKLVVKPKQTRFPLMSKILPSRRAGFSLVEILVSVAIIATLAMFTIPTMQGMRDHSRRAACISNMRQLAAGCILYAQDNDGGLPFWGNGGSWHRHIYPYLHSEKEESDWQAEGEMKAKYYFCPADKTPYNEKLSYSWNRHLARKDGQARADAFGTEPMKLGGLSRPAVMLGEGVSYWFSLAERTALEFRHGDSANFAFTDGRIESRKKAEVTEEFLKVDE